ncbi:efflux transporter outer membrane subunit [Bdellovibrio sp. HCB2-146]|uniref:efflux transporter outer membrane subunit n=1 Tax=Bdellovibrio sp. HCB2-146 TaxID=3394362 RepID=UPI0039BC747D
MNKALPLIVLATVTGCKTGPDYKRPAVELPPAEKSTSATVAQIPTDWWNLFGDKQLQALVQEALVKNQDLALAMAKLDEARALAGVSRADYYPTLDLGGRFGESKISEVGSSAFIPGMNRTSNTNIVGLIANYELDLWGKVRRANEASRARLFEADYNRVNVQLQIASLVAFNYIHLRALDSQLQISQETYRSRQDSYDLISKRFKGGMSSELDARQSEAEMHESRGQISKFEQEISAAENSLAVLLGRTPKEIYMTTVARGKQLSEFLKPPELPKELSSQILERRPDIMAAEQNLIGANAQIGVAKSYYFPSISLFAGIGSDSSDLSNLFKGQSETWSYGINLSMPIFNAGKIGYLVEATTARQQQALAAYQKSIQIAFTEVRDALKAYEKQGELVESKTAEVTALQRNVHLAKLRYNNGQSPYLEVLDAERRLFQADLSRVNAVEGHLAAVVSLYKSLGGGWTLNK